jgi:DNA-binding transcriptional ArsR family regulator
VSNHAELIEIADAISETDPALACRLRALAARVRSQERCLDELVEDSRVSARMAESVAVEHLARYRRKGGL